MIELSAGQLVALVTGVAVASWNAPKLRRELFLGYAAGRSWHMAFMAVFAALLFSWTAIVVFWPHF